MKYVKLYEKYRHDNQSLILERSIEVGDNLVQKLNKINSPLSKKIKTFLNSGDIKDDVKVTKIDFDDDDNKVFTLTDEKGEERKFKFGKLLKYLGFSDEIKGYEIENFVSNFKKSDTSNLELRKGEDILKSYLCDNYDDSSGHGNLFNSCMRFTRAQDYLEIYTANPSQVNCLTLINPSNKRVQGRALIWKLDSGKHFMDRIYTVNKEYDSIFNKYAHDNNIEQGSPSDEITLEIGGDFDYYPYMDTFTYYTPDESRLSSDDGDLSLTSTTGDGGSANTVWSDFMQEEIEENEAIFSERLDDWIYDHDAVDIYNGRDEKTREILYSKYPDNNDLHEVTIASSEYYDMEGEKAHIDDLHELEHDEDKYVLKDDSDIYSDEGWGIHIRSSEASDSDFDRLDIDLFSILVTYENSSSFDIDMPQVECSSVWNKEKNDFVIIPTSEIDDDYDDETYIEVPVYNVREMTERAYIPESFFGKDDEGEISISIISPDAPFFIDIISRNFVIKAIDDDNKTDTKTGKIHKTEQIHYNLFLHGMSVMMNCKESKSGYRIFPPMSMSNYNDYNEWLQLNHKNMSKGDVYFNKSFAKGEYLENSLSKVTEDKNSYVFTEFNKPEFIEHPTQDGSLKLSALKTFIDLNNAKHTKLFPFTDNVSNKLEYASWFSFYKHKGHMIFPYVYSPDEDKYVVYRGDSNESDESRNFRLYTANEIMNLVQYGAI